MAKKIFLSFRYKDATLRGDLQGLFKANGGTIEATPVYCKRDESATTEAAIKSAIKQSLQGCRGLLMVPGDDGHSAPWIKYEVSVALSDGLPCAVVDHPLARGGPPAEHHHLPRLRWDKKEIAEHVRSW